MDNDGYNSRTITEGIMVGGNIDPLESTPFWVSDFMTQNRFETTLYSFKYTSEGVPQYKDPFNDLRQTLGMWNKNMDQYFTPIWITYLYKSFSFWSNSYNFPGFMFVPWKPWTFGKEYHIICCRLSVIYLV